ncbi:phosphoglycerate mutase [cyanobacterium endosymbiont of Rhopalodia gibberula]|uniref:histidine phosphatase family protein n=1 Tax=cyanobacterium endosymbiont of Rhopalodia gibberula TaxID=1763363 RepID=UPI000DC6FD93|nr:histidine phosphatase family protein [cyanobacterium endosymbiont of Rhopalodia gibberula]BBA79882.1 phosphoglycerate mutase [cyanobacterium endosymbiont of Rhopalodia gibberula]
MNSNQTVWIARHGNRLDFVNPEWFDTAEYPYDPPLSEDGIIQAQQLGKRLQSENIVHIFASPFLRTIQTAHQVAEILDLEIKLEAGLAEWYNPEWMSEHPTIHPPDYLNREYPRINWHYSSKFIPQYPETETKVMQRTGEIVKQLIAEFSEDILLVGHGISVLGTTWGLVAGTPKIRATLCCLVKVVYKDDRWQLKLNGDTSHLNKKESKISFF